MTERARGRECEGWSQYLSARQLFCGGCLNVSSTYFLVLSDPLLLLPSLRAGSPRRKVVRRSRARRFSEQSYPLSSLLQREDLAKEGIGGDCSMSFTAT